MATDKLTESYFRCTSDEKPFSNTFSRLLSTSAESYADREAFVFCDENTRVTFGELKSKADKVAAGLLALGLQPGDRLVIWAPCCLEWIVTQYACIRAGIIYTGLNPAYPPSEAAEILQRLNPTCILTGPRFKSGDACSVLCEVIPELKTSEGDLKSERFPELKYVIVASSTEMSGITPLKSLFSLGGEKELTRINELETTIKPSDPVTIQLTSGTTGTPKAVILTNFHLINTCHFLGKRIGFGSDDTVHRLGIPGLIFRCAIMVLGSLCNVMYGLTSVVPSKIPNPEKSLKALSQERCTCVFGNPPMLAALLKCPDFENYDISSLTTAILGGSACALNLMKLVVNKFNLQKVLVGLPMTEIGGIALATHSDCTLETKCDTIGYPLENLEVKIIDKEGTTVPINTTGELCVRGFAVPPGYYEAGVVKPTTDNDGWFNSGDMVSMDERGYVSTMGRKKDVIIKESNVLYPKMIEEVLVRHPNIASAEVVGVPANATEQKVCACVVRKGEITEKDVQDFCKEGLTHVPDIVCFVDSFPKTLTMKVRKNILAEEMTKKLSL